MTTHTERPLVNKHLVQTDLLPVAVEIHALPGDHLMVFNGVCLGVYTGEPSRAPHPHKAPPPLLIQEASIPKRKATKPQASLPGLAPDFTPAKPAKPGKKWKRPSPDIIEALRVRVIDVLAKRGEPVTMVEIITSLRLNAQSETRKQQARRLVQKLTVAGELIGHGPKHDRTYTLPPSPTEATPEVAQ